MHDRDREASVPPYEAIEPHYDETVRFEPYDDAERALYDAAARGDREAYVRTLLGIERLCVPTVDGTGLMSAPGRPGFPWRIDEDAGRTAITVFTGPDRLREATGGLPFAESDLTKVLRYWPDPSVSLVVNGPVPIGATVPGEGVASLADWADTDAANRLAADFPAQSDVEREMLDRAVRGDVPGLVEVLRQTNVFLPVWAGGSAQTQVTPADPDFPWSMVPVKGRPSVQVFTSFEWLKRAVGTTGFVMPSFTELVTAWPEARPRLVLNPGTPIDLSVPGDDVRALAEAPEPDDAPAAPEDTSVAAPPAAAPPADISADPVPEAPRPEPSTAPPMETAAFAPAAPAPAVASMFEPHTEETTYDPPVATSAHEAPAFVPPPDDTAANVPFPDGTSMFEPHRATPTDDASEPSPADVVPDEAPPHAPVETPVFEPANDVEGVLFDAASRGDETLVKALLGAPLLLPIPSGAPDEVRPGDVGFGWRTIEVDGGVAVALFTSEERLRAAMGRVDRVTTGFLDVVRAWPDPEWSLSVNPGTPEIGVLLPPERVRALTPPTTTGEAVPEPPAPAEPATGSEVPETAPPDTKVPAEPIVPPEPAIPFGAVISPDALVLSEPDTSLEPAGHSEEPTEAVPPGTEAAEVDTLEADVSGMGAPTAEAPDAPAEADLDAPSAAPPATLPAGVIMQKVVPHAHVGWYLDHAYDRTGGFVNPASDVAELRTPERIYQALGLGYAGSPFSPEDREVHVIRWPAYCPELYRTPLGGRDEQTLATRGDDGWVVEAAPFEGDGFAPGSAGGIPEYKVESVRLPHGAQMYAVGGDGDERLVALYDADRLTWLRTESPADHDEDA